MAKLLCEEGLGTPSRQLFLRAIGALSHHGLVVPDGFSTYIIVKKRKVWSTKLAVLLIVQINSVEEQINFEILIWGSQNTWYAGMSKI